MESEDCSSDAALFTSAQKIVAVGEMDLDLTRDPSEKERRLQETVLREQLEIAVKFPSKPFVIHARDAMISCLRIVREMVSSDHSSSPYCGLFMLALLQRRGGAGLVDLTPCEILQDPGDINRMLPPLARDTS